MIAIQYNSTFHKNNIEMWLYTQTSKKLRPDGSIHPSDKSWFQGKNIHFNQMNNLKNRTEADWKTCAPLLRDCLVLRDGVIDADLGGGFKYVLCPPLFGEDSHFD